jgi:hypothetical protein
MMAYAVDIVILTRAKKYNKNSLEGRRIGKKRRSVIIFSLIYKYCKNVLAGDFQTQGRLKLMTELYVSEKPVINSKYFISPPS